MKIIRLFYPILILILITGCSELGTDPDPEEEIEVDSISGTYHLEGTKINMVVCRWVPTNCEVGEILESDTLDVEYTIEIERVESKKDTLSFIGLDGANAGDDKVLPEGCAPGGNLCAYANFDGEEIEFNLSEVSGIFTGNGTLIDDKLTLSTEFQYRGTEIHWELEGFKLEP